MSQELDKTGILDGYQMGFLVAYNIIVSMCFGKMFSFDDPFFKNMVEETKKQDETFNDIGITDSIPIFKYLNRGYYVELKKYMEMFKGYMEKVIADHEKDFSQDPEKHTDFTYYLLKVMKDAEQNPEDKKELQLLTRENFVHILIDLFFAGTDTTRFTLNWMWHYLAAFPEVQRKAQKEIDEVLGPNGEVTIDCKEKLPYIDAFVHEVLRIRSVLPLGVFHRTSEDIKLGGYDIPKNTGLICNTYSIHMDENNWKDPEAFLPERWLTEDGSYVYQQKGFVPFSVGRRSCIGESFAKVELHLLVTMLLQKYTLEPQPGFRVSVDTKPGAGIEPVDQKPIQVKRRT